MPPAPTASPPSTLDRALMGDSFSWSPSRRPVVHHHQARRAWWRWCPSCCCPVHAGVSFVLNVAPGRPPAPRVPYPAGRPRARVELLMMCCGCPHPIATPSVEAEGPRAAISAPPTPERHMAHEVRRPGPPAPTCVRPPPPPPRPRPAGPPGPGLPRPARRPPGPGGRARHPSARPCRAKADDAGGRRRRQPPHGPAAILTTADADPDPPSWAAMAARGPVSHRPPVLLARCARPLHPLSTAGPAAPRTTGTARPADAAPEMVRRPVVRVTRGRRPSAWIARAAIVKLARAWRNCTSGGGCPCSISSHAPPDQIDEVPDRPAPCRPGPGLSG